MGILGIYDLGLGRDFLCGRRFDQLEVKGGDFTVKPQEGLVAELVPDVSLGLQQDALACYGFGMTLATPVSG